MFPKMIANSISWVKLRDDINCQKLKLNSKGYKINIACFVVVVFVSVSPQIKAFTRNGKETIVPLQPGVKVMGQRNSISPLDIKQANLLYNCQSKLYHQSHFQSISGHSQIFLASYPNCSGKGREGSKLMTTKACGHILTLQRVTAATITWIIDS